MWSSDPVNFPSVTYIDMVNYFVLGQSPFYTMKDFKNYRSLESYDRFVSGWVRKVETYKYIYCDTKPMAYYVVRGKVNHIQRLSETPLQAWFICGEEGTIITAHCNCMAGLGETCSHLASIMFFVEAAVRLRDKQTVTQEAAYWKLPSVKKQVEYAPIKLIKFTSSRHLKKELEARIDSVSTVSESTHMSSKSKAIYQAGTENFAKFLNEIAGGKPSFLSVHPCYVDSYIPKIVKSKYPVILTSLYDPDSANLSFPELARVCQNISREITITEKQRKIVEKETRYQASSQLWFSFRAGRITASKIKAATATNYLKPSMSLLKAICYPQEMRFSTPATRWGIEHEEVAKKKYYQLQSAMHTDLSVIECGLFLSTDNPFLGATPDGIVNCMCEGCVIRCLEIKCPYNLCLDTLENPPAGSFLEVCKTKGVQLKRNHQYYFQAQAQMALTNTKSCDFFVWTTADTFLERIMFDNKFWEHQVKLCQLLFENAILPELVGKYFTNMVFEGNMAHSVAEDHSYEQTV